MELGLEGYVIIALAVVGVFAQIAAMTPNKADDKIVQVLLNIINIVGRNVGKAKNDPKNDSKN